MTINIVNYLNIYPPNGITHCQLCQLASFLYMDILII